MKKIHRFITEYRKSGNTLDIIDTETIHQIKDVLKLRSGENCTVVDSSDQEYTCTIQNALKDKISCEIIETKINTAESIKKVTLYQSILKKENFELIAQKAGEIGIHTIVPVISQRTIKTNLNTDRLYKIAREASELSGRNSVTEIQPIINFTDAIKNDTNTNKVLFDISGKDINKGKPLIKDAGSIYIGPEGGFTEDEINFAKENNIQIHNLGQLTLRGETASIIASYLALQ